MTTHPGSGAPRDGAAPPFVLLVHRTTWEADGVLSLELVHPEGKPLPPWSPGAHLDVSAGGHLRQYSLCSDPRDTGRYRIGVLDEPDSRGGSRYIHTTLRPGQTVEVAGPRNHFALEEAEAYVFLAGGIGITPLLPMAREAERLGVPYRLVHGGRSRLSMAFREELAALRGGTVQWVPQDELGHIDLRAALADLSAGTLVYCCGPEPLLAAVEAACPAAQLRLERFAAPTGTGGPADARNEHEDAFEVECRASGVTLDVPPDTSVLDAAEAAGLPVASSCRDGICGTCETRVLEGTPDHRDFLLSESERAASTTMMICVSRCASGRLVLDL